MKICKCCGKSVEEKQISRWGNCSDCESEITAQIENEFTEMCYEDQCLAEANML